MVVMRSTSCREMIISVVLQEFLYLGSTMHERRDGEAALSPSLSCAEAVPDTSPSKQ
jgi:hypothetical protein